MVEIKLKNVRCYSHHGCLKEETLIGSEYLVNLSVRAKLGKSHLTDNLEDAIDYVFLNAVIKEEMAVSSKLLETVVKKQRQSLLIVRTVFVFKKSWYSQFDESLLCRESTKRLAIKIDSMHYLFLRLAFFFIWLTNNSSS